MGAYFDEETYRALARQASPDIADILDTGLAGLVDSAGAAAADSATAAATSATAAATSATAAASEALVPTVTHTTSQTAAFGSLVVIDATSGNLTVTAPNPAANAGKRWGLKLLATASAHTVAAVAHGAETFDGTTPLAPTAVLGSMLVYTSDGTNWVLTGKI